MSKRSSGWVRALRACALGGVSTPLGTAVLLLSAAAAWAGAPTEQLKASVDQVLHTLDDPALRSESKAKERRAAIRQGAEKIFDFPETAKRALGPHWQSLGDKDRQEFVGLFADLLERSYVSKIERYSGEKVTYTGEAIDGDQATVKTRFITKQGTEVPVDYRMLQRGDRWLVYDVSVEGVSLVANYRTQFNKIIQTASYEELVKKMKTRDQDLPQGKSPGS